MAVKPIPDGYTSLTPYLFIGGAAKALEFYKAAFGAVEIFRMPGPGGLVGHAEMKIGNAIFMFSDENPKWGTKSPTTLGGSPASLMVYVENVDEAFEKAVAAGATVVRPLANQFYGDRSGSLVDPFGHQWMLATHIEDVPPEEMTRRMAEMAKTMGENCEG
ncbi:VOC family protein [Zavarzinella formosa]|uniref:VOC family protein n=1 Tax=Zavarzinella formosa TaxID=360055 RepID=UPI0002D6FF85|nr:VOC family protein [Zavarzinella formosa]